MGENRFCESCGAKLSGDDAFCVECGAPVGSLSVEEAVAEAPVNVARRAPLPPNYVEPEPGKKHGCRTFLILLVLLGGGIVFLFVNPSTGDPLRAFIERVTVGQVGNATASPDGVEPGKGEFPIYFSESAYKNASEPAELIYQMMMDDLLRSSGGDVSIGSPRVSNGRTRVEVTIRQNGETQTLVSIENERRRDESHVVFGWKDSGGVLYVLKKAGARWVITDIQDRGD